MNFKIKIFFSAFLIIIACFGIYYWTWPVYPDFTREVDILDKDSQFVYIDETNPCLSQIKYKEILDGRTFASKSTGRYEMSSQYTYDDFDYQIDIVVEDKYHFADYEHYQTYKGTKYRVNSGESSIEYLTFIENYLGDYVYIVYCRFNTEHLIKNKDQHIQATQDIALKLSHELIDKYILKNQ